MGLTLIGVSVTNLDNDRSEPARGSRSTRSGAAPSTLAADEVRDRFGTAAVTRAVLLGPRPGSPRCRCSRTRASRPAPVQDGRRPPCVTGLLIRQPPAEPVRIGVVRGDVLDVDHAAEPISRGDRLAVPDAERDVAHVHADRGARGPEDEGAGRRVRAAPGVAVIEVPPDVDRVGVVPDAHGDPRAQVHPGRRIGVEHEREAPAVVGDSGRPGRAPSSSRSAPCPSASGRAGAEEAATPSRTPARPASADSPDSGSSG